MVDDAPVLVTEPAPYRIHAKRSTHVWLEVLHGEDAGIRVSVPRYEETIDGDLTETLSGYDPGDIITATLESPRNPPDWRIRNVYGPPKY